MNWRDDAIPNDPETGRPIFKGLLKLSNDKNEQLASILWFYDGGPFYAHAVDLKEPDVIRRIGPCETIERAKEICMLAIEGKILDLNLGAGYER